MPYDGTTWEENVYRKAANLMRQRGKAYKVYYEGDKICLVQALNLSNGGEELMCPEEKFYSSEIYTKLRKKTNEVFPGQWSDKHTEQEVIELLEELAEEEEKEYAL